MRIRINYIGMFLEGKLLYVYLSFIYFSDVFNSSMTIAMDRPNYSKEIPVKNAKLFAFYPDEKQRADAAQLGFPTSRQIPFVSLRFINRADYISLDPSGKDTRKILHLPCTAVIERNGLISLKNGVILTIEKEEELSVIGG